MSMQWLCNPHLKLILKQARDAEARRIRAMRQKNPKLARLYWLAERRAIDAVIDEHFDNNDPLRRAFL